MHGLCPLPVLETSFAVHVGIWTDDQALERSAISSCLPCLAICPLYYIYYMSGKCHPKVDYIHELCIRMHGFRESCPSVFTKPAGARMPSLHAELHQSFFMPWSCSLCAGSFLCFSLAKLRDTYCCSARRTSSIMQQSIQKRYARQVRFVLD